MARYLYNSHGSGTIGYFDSNDKYLYAADSNACIAYRQGKWMYRMDDNSAWGYIQNNYLYSESDGQSIGYFHPTLN